MYDMYVMYAHITTSVPVWWAQSRNWLVRNQNNHRSILNLYRPTYIITEVTDIVLQPPPPTTNMAATRLRGRRGQCQYVTIQRYRKSHTKFKVSKMHILRWFVYKFCVKFQNRYLVSHTKFRIHTQQIVGAVKSFTNHDILNSWHLKS